MVRKWLVSAVLAVLALVGAVAVSQHYHHYGRQPAQVDRADMYVRGDMYNTPWDMY
jgi:hypothetical protein